jgi:hypothetical protein
MNPSPFVSDDYLQARLALPFHKPLVRSADLFGFNPRMPLIERPFYPKAIPALQPMQSIQDVKGYLFGGLIPTSDQDMKDFAEKLKQEKTPRQRLNEWGNENKDFVNALARLLK